MERGPNEQADSFFFLKSREQSDCSQKMDNGETRRKKLAFALLTTTRVFHNCDRMWYLLKLINILEPLIILLIFFIINKKLLE